MSENSYILHKLRLHVRSDLNCKYWLNFLHAIQAKRRCTFMIGLVTKSHHLLNGGKHHFHAHSPIHTYAVRRAERVLKKIVLHRMYERRDYSRRTEWFFRKTPCKYAGKACSRCLGKTRQERWERQTESEKQMFKYKRWKSLFVEHEHNGWITGSENAFHIVCMYIRYIPDYKLQEHLMRSNIWS